MTTYVELKQKAEDLMRQAEAARKSEIAGAIAEIKSKMAMYGITVEDLGESKRAARGRKAKVAGGAKPGRMAGKIKVPKVAKARKPVAAKYRNAETGETWSGRGKAPKWLTTLEAMGRRREEFSVSHGG